MLVTTAVEELRARLGELNEDFWTDDQVYRNLDEAQKRFCSEEEWQFLYTTYTATLAAGDTVMNLPDNVEPGDIRSVLMTVEGQLVPFEPRMVLPLEGFKLRRMFYVNSAYQYPISYYVSANVPENVDEVQTLANAGSTSGTFTITFEGQTTGVISRGATAAVIEAALKALSNVGPDDVNVTGGALGTATVYVTFTNALGASDRTAMTLGGTTTSMTVATTTPGVGTGMDFVYSVTFVPALVNDADLEFLYVRPPRTITDSTLSIDVPERYAMGVVDLACGMLWLKELSDGNKAQEQFQLYQQVVAQARKRMSKASPNERLAWGKNDPEGFEHTSDEWTRLHIPPTLGP